ncbi:MAG: hypothetical protein L6R42_010263 [Xanthoria sp. 1 TBL-2021]|nr:MAG: hypothetical protein L6R42_010263 [Xanthoria sp. 1 TBL-2021]
MRFAAICSVLPLLAAPLAIIAAPAPAPAAVANPEPHSWGYGKGRGGHSHGGYDKDEVGDETDDQGEFLGGAEATGTFTGFGAVPTGGNDDNAAVGNDSTAVGNDDNTVVGNDDSTAVGNDSTAVGNDDNAVVGDSVPTPVVQGSTSNGNIAGAGADEDGEAVDEATTTTSSTRSTPTG